MTAPRAAAVLAALLLTAPGLAAAQPSQPQPAQRGGAAARPNAGPASGPGMAPLQTEPGDVWAEVRSWTERRPKPGAAPTPKPPAAAACAAGEPDCPPRPARKRPAARPPE